MSAEFAQRVVKVRLFMQIVFNGDMKCQNLLSGKNKKNIISLLFAEFFPDSGKGEQFYEVNFLPDFSQKYANIQENGSLQEYLWGKNFELQIYFIIKKINIYDTEKTK